MPFAYVCLTCPFTASPDSKEKEGGRKLWRQQDLLATCVLWNINFLALGQAAGCF